MGQRILVVEDEAPILELVSIVLEEEGYSITGASNGAAALNVMTEDDAFDLVVLDMWMPLVNGWQFASTLQVRGIHVPLLVMTAASEARARAREVGAVGYIGKPFDVDQLVLAVRGALTEGESKS